MGSPSDLVELVLSRPPTLGGGRLLCLDGPAGSGKTTLAAAVAEASGATVVHLDDLYDGWDGLLHVEEQLHSLLLPLARGQAGRYRRYDWSRGRYAETVVVEPAPLLLLEGVGCGLAAFAELRTALVWVEADHDLRLARWRDRDGAAVEPHIAAWLEAEAVLFAREDTRAAADLIWPTDK